MHPDYSIKNFISLLGSEMLIELSYDLWTTEKQLELLSLRIHYTAIGWFWETSTCPNRYSFIFFNARRQVRRGIASLYGRTYTFQNY